MAASQLLARRDPTLAFHRVCADELLTSPDALLVLGKGMGERNVLAKVCLELAKKPPTLPGREAPLVFVVNASREATECLSNDVRDLWEREGSVGELRLPLYFDTNTSPKARLDAYATGGIVCPTSRVLLLDLLQRKFAPDSIDGMLLIRAHTIDEDSNEAFVAHVCRRWFPNAFVRAISDAPEVLAAKGFLNLAKRLRILGLRRLVLFPRNRQEAKDSLEGSNSPSVTEIAQPMSAYMLEVHVNALQALRACYAELGRCTSLDVSKFESMQTLRTSHQSLLVELLPRWHKTPQKAKDLVEDVKTLRGLLNALTTVDAVRFLTRLWEARTPPAEQMSYAKMNFLQNALVTAHTSSGPSANKAQRIIASATSNPQHRVNASLPAWWLMLDEADAMFRAARNRLYTFHESSKKVTVQLEPNLKINALMDAIKVARKKFKANDASDPLGFSGDLIGGADIVVVCRDDASRASVSSQILDYFLVNDSDASLTQLEMAFMNFLSNHLATPRAQKNPTEYAALLAEYERLTTRMAERQQAKRVAERAGSSSNGGSSFGFVSRSDQILVVTANAIAENVLFELLPRVVFVFDPVLSVIRAVEIFAASYPSWPVEVSLLYYQDSFEELDFFASIKEEKIAFSKLQDSKSLFVHAESSLTEESFGTGVGAIHAVVSASGRHHHGETDGPSMRVVMDLRERSSLNFVLFRSGWTLDPVDLKVGDYILSPEICVERKSIPDLKQSLGSGRLLKQVKSMCKHYRRPILLVEWGENEPFELTKFIEALELRERTMLSQLVTLLLHHPDLRLCWSSSPRATVGLFRELQKNQLPPLSDVSAKYGTEDVVEEVPHLSSGGEQLRKARIAQRKGRVVNERGLEALKKLPGVTSDNVHRLARASGSLARLARMTRDELARVLSIENANALYGFLHRVEVSEDVTMI